MSANKPKIERPNIFKTWRKMKTQQDPIFANALRELKERFGTEYTHSRYREWEEGTRLPQTEVFNYILYGVLNYYLAKNGMVDRKISQIIKNCTLNNI